MEIIQILTHPNVNQLVATTQTFASKRPASWTRKRIIRESKKNNSEFAWFISLSLAEHKKINNMQNTELNGFLLSKQTFENVMFSILYDLILCSVNRTNV